VAEFPALTLWTDAYLSDTRHLSTLEHGAYMLLLMEAWRRPNCDLPDDDKILARLAGLSLAEWEDIKDAVLAFWKRDGRSKTWSQKRLSLERGKARVRSVSQRDKVAKRWNKTKKQDTTVLPSEYPADTSTATATAHIEEEEPIGSPSSREDQKSDPPVVPNRSRKVSEETPLPEGFEPVLGPTRAAMVSVWPPGMLEDQIQRFRMHAIRNRRVARDWNAAFGTWADKADKGIKGYANRGQDFGGSASRHHNRRDGGDGFTRALDRAEDLLRGGGGPEVPPGTSRSLE
jgi:uncharacterized protein YdaU (DUF1376 family)